MRLRTSLVLGLAIVASCLVPNDFEKVDGVASGGAGGQAGGGGGQAGGGGDQAGGGGSIPCGPEPQNTCTATEETTLAGGSAGTITVTDVVRLYESSVALVGTYTGTVDFGGNTQLTAGSGTSGFVVEIDDGGVVGLADIPEATAGSKLFVDYAPSLLQVAVGGRYGPGSDCGGSEGLFIRRFDLSYATVNPVVCEEVTASQWDVTDVTISDALGYITLTGWLDGAIGGMTSDNIDGFTYSVDPDNAMPDPFLFTGPGDSVVSAIDAAPAIDNVTLLAGHFSGDMTFSFDSALGPQTVDVTATGQTDLWVMAIDRFEGDPQLSVRTFGGTEGDHRMIAMTTDTAAGAERRTHLLATLDGPIDLGGVDVASTGRPTALALTFDAPNGVAAYGYRDHYVIDADALGALDMSARGNVIFVGGHARGLLSATKSDQPTLDVATAQACLDDAFILMLEPDLFSVSDQRCGDGAQLFEGIAATDTGFAAALTIPAGASIDLGDGVQSDEARRTLLLRGAPPQ